MASCRISIGRSLCSEAQDPPGLGVITLGVIPLSENSWIDDGHISSLLPPGRVFIYIDDIPIAEFVSDC